MPETVRIQHTQTGPSDKTAYGSTQGREYSPYNCENPMRPKQVEKTVTGKERRLEK